jgi:mannose-1-phosphate guanylyltransferase
MVNPYASSFKGVILAAGLGTRLRPLTDDIPKPLVPFFGIPLLYLQMHKFSQAGIQHFAINGHHHWQKLKKALDAAPIKLDNYFSLESPQILGTAGAYNPLKEWREGKDLLVMNGDIICDYDLQALVQNHYENTKPLVTLGLLKNPRPGKTLIWCEDGWVIAIGGDKPTGSHATPHSFACIQLISDAFLETLPQGGPSEIIPIYKKILEQGGKIKAHIQDGFWHDIGSFENLFDAHCQIITHPQFNQLSQTLGISACHTLLNKNPHWIQKGQRVSLDQGSANGPCYIHNPCKLGKRTEIGPYTFIFDSTNFPDGTVIKNSLLLEDPSFSQAGEVLEGFTLSKKFRTKFHFINSDFL